MTATAPSVASERGEAARPFPWRQRLVLRLIDWAGFLVIRFIGPTLRTTISIEQGGPASIAARPVIFVFWHRCTIPAAYIWRHRDIQVMTSQSFDGEYIARIIERFGYGAVRGSSTRGGARGWLEMRREIEQDRTVAFTIDGPQGPKYVAKPGPVLLARATGVPIIAFHIALEDPWVLPTWDDFMVPRPFSRAFLCLSRQIHVPANADDAQLQHYHAAMQTALDRVRQFAENALAGRP